MDERWKAMPELNGYEISCQGRIRSYWKRAKGHPEGKLWIIAATPQRILSASGKSAHRYPMVCIRKKSYPVHRLVMLAFVGPCPDGLIVCHNNDNPADNRLSNLRYDTPASNVADAVRSGANRNNWQRKLTHDKAWEIRELARAGAPIPVLSDMYDVSTGTIQDCIARRGAYTEAKAAKEVLDYWREMNDNKTDSR